MSLPSARITDSCLPTKPPTLSPKAVIVLPSTEEFSIGALCLPTKPPTLEPVAITSPFATEPLINPPL